jgi:hypothetical protein
VLCDPGIALNFNSQVNLAGGAPGTGVDMPNGTAGENGRLAIYSQSAPAAFGAVITGTRYDHTLAAYPLALTVAGEPLPVVISYSVGLPNIAGNRNVSVNCQVTPGARYQLDRSTGLLTWTPEGTIRTAPASGSLIFNSTANAGATPRLYWRCRKL